jgi:spore coat protein A
VPVRVANFRHAAGERYEVIIDFASYPPGTTIDLLNTSPKNNVDYTHTNKVMRFQVTDEPFTTKNNSIPASLFPAHPAMTVSETEAVTTRRFDFARNNGLWTINGQTWDDVVASGFKSVLASPRTGTTEIWELRNLSGGWHHPAHIHFIDFKVLSRNGKPAMPHERGGKDVVFLGEYETVKVLIKFDHGRGKYMMHCHNLSHEDHDMMAQFEIVDDVIAAHDPMADPCRPLPEGDL